MPSRHLVYRDLAVDPADLVSIGGIRVTTPVRTLEDLCRVGDAEGLEKAMAMALDRPVSPDLLRARAAEFRIDGVARRYEQAFAMALDRHG